MLAAIFLGIFISADCIFAETFLEGLQSPVTTKAKNPFLIAAGLTLTTVILEDQVVDPVQEETIREKPLGRLSSFAELMGQLVPNVLYYGGMKTHSYFTDSQSTSLNAEIMLKATLYSAIVTNVLKYTIREPRPTTGGARNSFPSGHTTSAFAFASSVGAIHGWKWGAPAYLLAAVVGFSRINDNAHYLHDVLGGAAIGMGYGLGMTYLLKKEFVDENLVIYPIINSEKAGLAISYQY